MVALPLVQQHTKLKSLRSELAQAKEEAATASALQERVDRLIDQEQYVATLKQQTPAVVEMLNELTALLPDATWLHRLEVKKGQVHLQGTSDGASSLIARIEESDAFRNVRFGSPVTQDPTSGGERFQVRADIVKRNIGKEG